MYPFWCQTEPDILKCYPFDTLRNYPFSYKSVFGRIIRIRLTSSPTPVITRNPAFACPTPSLEWDCDPATTRLGEGVKNIPEGETPGIILSSGGFLLLEQPEEEEVTLEEGVGVIEGIKALE